MEGRGRRAIIRTPPGVLANRGSINQWLYRYFIHSVPKICSVRGLITVFPLLMLRLLMTREILYKPELFTKIVYLQQKYQNFPYSLKPQTIYLKIGVGMLRQFLNQCSQSSQVKDKKTCHSDCFKNSNILSETEIILRCKNTNYFFFKLS